MRVFLMALVAVVFMSGAAGAQTLTDVGTANPTPGPKDIFQLSTNGNTAANTPGTGRPDGLNYYTDNSIPPGSTFTTTTNTTNLVALAVRTAGLDSGGGYGTPATTPTYCLRLYFIFGTTPNFVAAFTNASPGFTDGDWLKWNNLSVTLAPNATYAYTVDRLPGPGGYCALAVASSNRYAGGEIVLVPTNGGAITLGSSHGYDAVFDLGMKSDAPTANTPAVSPAGAVYAGTTVTLSESALGTGTLSYQWQVPAGMGHATENIPGATNANYPVTLTNAGAYPYDVVVSNSYGTATSGTVTVTVLPAPGTANVSVNVAGVLSTVGPTGYGIHTSVYDNQNGNAALPDFLIQSGVKALRYPGGGYADVFHWSVTQPALGSGNGYGFTPWFGVSNSYGYMGSGTDFGSFVQLLTNAQCQAIITVNFGSGLNWSSPAHTSLTIPPTNAEPPEAAAWVAYANASTNIYGTTNDVTLGVDSIGNDWKTAGYWALVRAASPLGTDDGYNFLRINHPMPIGIKFWEIGNETFGTGYYDSGGDDGYCLNYAVPYPYTNYMRYGNTNLSPAAYGRGVKSFSLLMKAVDPTIKIGAVVSTPPGDYSWDTDTNGQHWTPLVLAQCASNIDFVISHWYPYAGDSDNGSNLLPDVPATLPVMINGTGTHTGTDSGLRDWINDYRADGTNVQIFITEFNYMGSEVDSVNGESIFGPVNTLFAADSYATWLELGVSNVDWLEMNKTTFLGDGDPPVPGASYYAVQLTHDMAAPGDELVSTTSDTSTLRVHAALKQNGAVGVMLLNENMSSNFTVNVSIPNTSLGSTATEIQFGTNNYPGGTETPGSPPVTNTIAVSGNSLTVIVPPYTIAELTIPIQQGVTPPTLAGISNRTVDPGQTVAFIASATDTNLPPRMLTFSLLSGAPTNATVNSNTGAFSWRPLVTQANTANPITLQVTASGGGVAPQMASQTFTVTVNPLTAPSVTPAVLSNGHIRFQIGGAAGPDYAVEGSTNLVDWTTLFITNSPTPPFTWTDTNAAVLRAQFYRVKIGPPLP